MVLKEDCGYIKKSKSGKGFIIIDRSRPLARKFTGSLKSLKEFVDGDREEVLIAEVVFTEKPPPLA